METCNNELYHHGVKGMKWGLRRYQNKDGSLTPAGRRRVDKMKDEYTQLTGKKLIRKPSSKTSKSTEPENKKIKDLTDAELNDRINRLQKEKQLVGLQKDLSSKGKKFVSAVGTQVVAPAAAEAGKELLKNVLLKFGKEKLGLNSREADGVDAVYKELKKEVDTLNLKRNKYKFEDEIRNYEKKRASEKAKAEEETSRKPERVEPELVKAKKVKPDKKTSFTKSDPTIIDADWTKESSDSTAIVPYVNRGESLVDRLRKKRRG